MSIDAEIAAVYGQAVAVGYPPTKGVAEVFGFTHAVAAKRVQQARRSGLLPVTERGRKAANVDAACPTCGRRPGRY